MRTLLSISVLALSLSACSYSFKAPVNQGNLPSAKAIQKLHHGMSRDEVSQILGDSLLQTDLSPQHTVYLSSHQSPGHKMKIRKLTLRFKDDKLAFFALS